MILNAREQVKALLAMKAMTLKKLAELISEKTGKKCSLSALSNKLRRGTITYNEVMRIAEYLGFKISYDFDK
ncbi:hypothetical protein IJ541_11240 [bacterium]|nr:hypothetical protein [bacterium]